MIYVYCRRGSDGARALSNELQGQRIRNFDGMRFWRKNKPIKLEAGDVIVSWGDALPDGIGEGVKVLNGAETPNKYDTAMQFSRAGIPTVQVYKQNTPMSDSRYREMINGGYLPRMNNHVGGNDLLNFSRNPDFWVQKVTITEEYRIHSFNGKSIRAGKKILREGFSLDEAEASSKGLQLASPWIRSFDAGWRICYDSFKSNAAMREIAHKAVASLGLTFGAVDIGKMSNGQYIVLEVNRAPGLEGNSVKAYAAVIKEWINETLGVQAGAGSDGQGIQPEGGEAIDPFVNGDGQPEQPVADAAGAVAPPIPININWDIDPNIFGNLLGGEANNNPPAAVQQEQPNGNAGANPGQQPAPAPPVLQPYIYIGRAAGGNYQPAAAVPTEAGVPQRPSLAALGAAARARARQLRTPNQQVRPRIGRNLAQYRSLADLLADYGID